VKPHHFDAAPARGRKTVVAPAPALRLLSFGVESTNKFFYCGSRHKTDAVSCGFGSATPVISNLCFLGISALFKNDAHGSGYDSRVVAKQKSANSCKSNLKF
jgi:hypothetical protein